MRTASYLFYQAVQRPIYILIYLIPVISGSFAGVLHPMPDFDYTPWIGRVTADFRVPPGWDALPIDPKSPHHATLFQVVSGSKQHNIVVSLDFYHLHSFVKEKTQQGSAANYLDGIQRHDDPNVKMDLVSTFQSERNGPINLYRYHYANRRERWAVFIVAGDYEVQLEICAPDFADEATLRSCLELVARGVSISKAAG